LKNGNFNLKATFDNDTDYLKLNINSQNTYDTKSKSSFVCL